MDIKNNFKLLGAIVVIMFGSLVFFNERRLSHNKADLKERMKEAVAVSVKCDKNIRSSMYTLHYEFSYKNNVYSGLKDFNIQKRGNVCNGIKFLVLFDSVNPANNEILLDSVLK